MQLLWSYATNCNELKMGNTIALKWEPWLDETKLSCYFW